MRVSVFGLGYVGCISAACLAREGHEVVGVDVNPSKVQMINDARSPIVEAGLDAILKDVRRSDTGGGGHLRATTDAADAVSATDVSLICVGTPSEESGSLDLRYVRRCAVDIGRALAHKADYHVVVARSTMLPGSVEATIVPAIERESSRQVGDGFGVAMNPEFLREGTSIGDFYDPPATVVGEFDSRSGDAVVALYNFVDAPLVRTDIRTAEMVKYASNAFHALKVTFANEIGILSKVHGVDGHRVMDIFCLDRKLNISSHYLKPGFAFGGSCLPKDLRALTHRAKHADVEIPLIDAIMRSNRLHIERAVADVVRTGLRKVGVLGLSFKAGTDDLRDSPMVSLTETLIGKGFDVRIYDENVAISRIFGANKEYIERQIPHISSLMRDDIDEVVAHAEVVVVGNRGEAFDDALRRAGDGRTIIDLVRLEDAEASGRAEYVGICW